jgi:hypothetical protein
MMAIPTALIRQRMMAGGVDGVIRHQNCWGVERNCWVFYGLVRWRVRVHRHW